MAHDTHLFVLISQLVVLAARFGLRMKSTCITYGTLSIGRDRLHDAQCDVSVYVISSYDWSSLLLNDVKNPITLCMRHVGLQHFTQKPDEAPAIMLHAAKPQKLTNSEVGFANIRSFDPKGGALTFTQMSTTTTLSGSASTSI